VSSFVVKWQHVEKLVNRKPHGGKIKTHGQGVHPIAEDGRVDQLVFREEFGKEIKQQEYTCCKAQYYDKVGLTPSQLLPLGEKNEQGGSEGAYKKIAYKVETQSLPVSD
jgi:hypothetical protein